MVDLSKHIARANQAIERRNYDMALEIAIECQEVDPANVEVYGKLIEAAKRKAKESGKSAFGAMLTIGLSRDPQKRLSVAVRKVSKNPDLKTFLAAGDAAKAVADGGLKGLLDVAVLFYEEARATGLFSKDLLWNLAHAYHAKFEQSKGADWLEKAIQTLVELLRGDPTHGEAGRTVKNWEALRSIARRHDSKRVATDYRSQVADDSEARRNEVMNRVIRTAEDAREVVSFLDQDLAAKPDDKGLWVKRSDVLRRVELLDEARASLEKARALDPHDFLIEMRLGDLAIHTMQSRIAAAQKAGQDVSQLTTELQQLEVSEFRNRCERQPTEMSHHYNLALRLYQAGDIDGAAGEFQASVKDPRFRRQSHNYLGHCFARKKLLDLAQKQFTDCLSLIEDHLSDEYKDALYNRARVAEAAGDTSSAMADFTTVVEIDLGFRDAAQRLSKLRG